MAYCRGVPYIFWDASKSGKDKESQRLAIMDLIDDEDNYTITYAQIKQMLGANNLYDLTKLFPDSANFIIKNEACIKSCMESFVSDVDAEYKKLRRRVPHDSKSEKKKELETQDKGRVERDQD